MAKSALGRRRGTKSRSSGWCGEHPMLRALVVGMALVTTGLVGGLLFGMARMKEKNVTGSANPESATVDKASHLRAGVSANDGHGLALVDPDPVAAAAIGVIVAEMSLAQRKDAFLAHKPQNGNLGPFPYYPRSSTDSRGVALVDPNHDFSSFTAPGGHRYEEWRHGDTPYTFRKGESDDLARSRRYHVKKAMQFAWAAYEQYAFGMDEIKPQSMTGSNGWGGFGTTLVDSLDTLWLMGMKEEFQRARDWVRDSLNNNRNRMVSFFETTIRSLGGLLAGRLSWIRSSLFLLDFTSTRPSHRFYR